MGSAVSRSTCGVKAGNISQRMAFGQSMSGGAVGIGLTDHAPAIELKNTRRCFLEGSMASSTF